MAKCLSGFVVLISFVVILAYLYLQTKAALQAARDQTRVVVVGEWLAKDQTLAALVLLEVERPDDTQYATARMTEALREMLSSERYAYEDQVIEVAFSPDGTQIVTASRDGTVRVWRADGAGEPIVLKGHEGAVVSATFSPDGTQIVTASRDGTAQVWRTDGTGKPVVLRGHKGYVMSAAFSPDGTWVVTASVDKTARVWTISGERLQAVIRSATTVCLDPLFRERYLGESHEDASQKYQKCERARGRSGVYTR